MNIFQVADNDQSIVFLGQIFGNVGIALSGSGSAILSNMFKTFNGILLVIGSLFVIYVTIVGLIETSQEGSFMGKKFNSVWTPLRMVMGIAALFPTKSGYCAIQAIVMWIIVQGIGAADTVWKTTIDYVAQGGNIHDVGTSGAQSSMTNPDQTDTSSQGPAQTVFAPMMMQKLFASLVCQSVMVKTAKKDVKAVAHSTLLSSGQSYSFGRNFSVPEDEGAAVPIDACGTMNWSVNDAALQTAAGNAMQTLVPVLEVLADKYVTSIIQSESCWVPCTPTLGAPDGGGQCIFGKWSKLQSPLPDSCPINADAGWKVILSFAGSNFMTDAIQMLAGYANNYEINAALERTKQEQAESGSLINPNASTAYQKAQANGWIFAGAYYYYIALHGNQAGRDFTKFYQSFQFPDTTGIVNKLKQGRAAFTGDDIISKAVAANGWLMQYAVCGKPDDTGNCKSTADGGGAGIVTAATDAMKKAQATGGTLEVDSGGGSNTALGNLNGVAQNIINEWMDNIAGQSNDPLIAVQKFGSNLLIAAEVLFWVYFGIAIGLGFVSAITVIFGTTVNPVYQVMANTFQIVTSVTFFMLVYFVSIGGLLGVYTPLIPYIIFTFGAIAWFISVIEAMVAAPIVALGILAPGGQHEVLGKAEPAVGILLNVFMRPTLMVFGMIGGMLLSYVVIKFINMAFMGVVASVHGSNRSMGLLEIFLFITAYAGLIVTALNKCFSLIYVIPEKSLRWIGMQGEAGGEEHAAEGVKGKVSAGGEAGGRAVGGTGSKVGGAPAGIQEDAKKKQKLKDAALRAGKTPPPKAPGSSTE